MIAIAMTHANLQVCHDQHCPQGGSRVWQCTVDLLLDNHVALSAVSPFDEVFRNHGFRYGDVLYYSVTDLLHLDQP